MSPPGRLWGNEAHRCVSKPLAVRSIAKPRHRTRHTEAGWPKCTIAQLFLIVGGRVTPATTTRGNARTRDPSSARMFAFNEPVAGQQLVEEQDQKRTGRRHDGSQRADRCDALALVEVRKNTATDDRAADPHGERRNRSARISPRHDGLGQQADNRAESDPHQDVVGQLPREFDRFGIHAAGPPCRPVSAAPSPPARRARAREHATAAVTGIGRPLLRP
jgi:hypothetical protein